MTTTDDSPKIKGAVIKDPRNWMRTAYGADAYREALESLKPDERAVIDGTIYESFWYPIEVWDRFVAAMRAQAQKRSNHSAHDFNMRNMREAGSAIIRSLYKFVLGLMSARSVIEKGVVIYSRAYSQGQFTLLENVAGRAVLRFSDGSPLFRENLTNMLPTGFTFLLELNGVKDGKAEITRDEVVDGKLVFEVTLTYAA